MERWPILPSYSIMKVIVSLMFEFTPLFFVYLWLENKTHWTALPIFGCSLMASAIGSYIGVRVFDLTVLGRYSMLEGNEALSVIESISIMGACLTLLGLTIKEYK